MVAVEEFEPLTQGLLTPYQILVAATGIEPVTSTL